MKKDFDGRVAVLVLYNPNKEQEEIKLFVDVTGRYAGGGARYINLPNFLYGGQKGGYDESEKKEISFNEEITIYNLVSQKRDGDEIKGPMWKLNVKLKIRDK
ncbi:hypothetical protein GCM10008905_10110 [Clostridium malenominatum]|uniref:Uncharacterized protein n=1 Tax=Clostridium malenominatum TaxID=1539 RepID=A0ABP3TYH1_9CLOT